MSGSNCEREANEPVNVTVLGIIKCCANVRRHCDEGYNDDDEEDGDDDYASKKHWFNIFILPRNMLFGSSYKIALLESQSEPSAEGIPLEIP